MKILTYKDRTWYVDGTECKDYEEALALLGVPNKHDVWMTRIKAENGVSLYSVRW